VDLAKESAIFTFAIKILIFNTEKHSSKFKCKRPRIINTTKMQKKRKRGKEVDGGLTMPNILI
jgi:hypothetical protein